MKQRLYLATGNLLRPLARLFKQASNVALEKGSREVTLAQFSEALTGTREDWSAHIKKGSQSSKQLVLPEALKDPFLATPREVRSSTSQLIELEVNAARQAINGHATHPSWVSER